jgi:hypothetical protein
MKLHLDFSTKPVAAAKKAARRSAEATATTIRVNFRPLVYLRHRTHSYLWLRDGYKYGYFLNMDSGVIRVDAVDIVAETVTPEVKADKKAGIKAQPAVTRDVYRVYEDRETFYDLQTYAYDFVKAVRKFHESTLRRTPEAEREMRQVLGIPLDTHLDDPRISGQGELEKAPRAERKAKASGEPKAAAGFTLQELCAELKLDPTEARKTMRGAKIEKPGARWEWATRADAAAVITLLGGKP